MALTCNIDARGKRIRLINGMVTLVIGLIVLFAWTLREPSPLNWGIAIFVLAAGAFMVFEARAGWCAMRAMGFKTKF
ncbi:hypothetical protein BH10PLA1_BH10PLA1_02920 [soil metagenome]